MGGIATTGYFMCFLEGCGEVLCRTIAALVMWHRSFVVLEDCPLPEVRTAEVALEVVR